VEASADNLYRPFVVTEGRLNFVFEPASILYWNNGNVFGIDILLRRQADFQSLRCCRSPGEVDAASTLVFAIVDESVTQNGVDFFGCFRAVVEFHRIRGYLLR
jgi:hypothetical protein